MSDSVEPSSFRDPSGFIFRDQHGVIFRQVNRSFVEHYTELKRSGLYSHLTEKKLLIDHEEVALSHALTDEAIAVIRPRQLKFLSYPYEWSFTALQRAALLTLDIQEAALQHGMNLKDASAYNIQYVGSHPLFIDTLSFEKYVAGAPWEPYSQFCRHFVAPLVLMSQVDLRLGRLLSLNLDGLPLDLAVKLLPFRKRLNPRLLMHLVLQAKMIQRHSDTSRPAVRPSKSQVSLNGLRALLGSLRSLIERLRVSLPRTEWVDYYAEHSYSEPAFEEKKRVVDSLLRQIAPLTVCDLGANTGVFSAIAAAQGADVVAFDLDPACVEAHFRTCVRKQVSNILPLVLDLTNPSPSVGWDLQERASFLHRGKADAALALAVIHHLAIGNNVPLPQVAQFLSRISDNLIIEFVPKSDPQVQRLLRGRKDIFDNYHQEAFERSFSGPFVNRDRKVLEKEGRTIYWLSRRKS